jgi:hypothetical protein
VGPNWRTTNSPVRQCHVPSPSHFAAEKPHRRKNRSTAIESSADDGSSCLAAGRVGAIRTSGLSLSLEPQRAGRPQQPGPTQCEPTQVLVTIGHKAHLPFMPMNAREAPWSGAGSPVARDRASGGPASTPLQTRPGCGSRVAATEAAAFLGSPVRALQVLCGTERATTGRVARSPLSFLNAPAARLRPRAWGRAACAGSPRRACERSPGR